MSLVSDKPDVCCTRVQHPVASKKDPLESEQAHTVRETHLAQETQLQPAPLVTLPYYGDSFVASDDSTTPLWR